MSLRDKAIKGVLWSAIQNWVSSLLGTVVFLILANLLEPRMFGLVALASVFTAFLGVFQRQGLAQAIVQRPDLEPGHLDTAFWTSGLAGLLLAAVLFASGGHIAQLWGEPSLGPVLQWLSVTLFIDALGNAPQAILRRDLAFKTLAVRSLTGALVGGIVGVAMAFTGFGVWSLVGQQLGVALAGTITLWTLCRWRPGVNVSIAHFKDLFGFGVYSMGNETVGFFNRRTPDLLIGTFIGAEALGYYTVGHRLLLILTRLFTNTVSAVALPTFSRLQHDRGQMRQAFLTATRITSLVAFPAFLGAAVLAPELVLALFGDKWVKSIPIMQILAFIGIVQSVSFFNGPVIIACGKPSWAFALAFANATASVVVLAVAIHWGIVVVAAAYVIRGYMYAPFPFWVVRKLIGLDTAAYLRQYVAPIVGSFAMVVVVLLGKHLLAPGLSPQALLAVFALSGIVAYTMTILLIAPTVTRQALGFLRLAVSAEGETE